MTFDSGTRIRTKAQHIEGHTRLPSYLQRKPGVIIMSLGAFLLADENAVDSRHARKNELYTVEFEASDVWNDPQSAGAIRADLFEEYLEQD